MGVIERKETEENLRESEERLAKLNECFLNFKADPLENINLLTALCGQILKADSALYNRVENGLLHSWGHWNTPADFKLVDKPEGHICTDVIKQGSDDIVLVRNLDQTQYAQTDPNINKYNLKTYIGRAVKLGDRYIGSLCVLYQSDFIPTDNDKRIMELISYAIAVEENRRQEQGFLKESELRYRTLAESAQDFIFIIDSEWHIQYINPFAAESIGCNAEEVRGKFLKEVFPQNITAFLEKDLVKVFVSGQAFSGASKVVFPDRELWLDTKLIPLKDASGNVNAVMGIARDITEHKEAEEELRMSEAQYRAIVEVQTELICRWFPDGRITFVNDAYCNYFGKRREELIGNNFMPLIPLEDQEKVKNNFALLSKERPIVMHEHRVIISTGEIRWNRWSNRALFDEQGNIIEIQSAGHDITERKKAEEEKETLNKELLQSNKRLRQLALRDPPTGLYNHRYLQEIIEAEFDRSRRYAQPLSVMMLDIDYFKSINDVYGHKFGDLVLKQFAKILKRMVRRYDTVIRYGGEEFIILCSGTDRSNALVLAKRILDAINLFDFGNKKHSVKLKLSIAVVSYNEDKAVKGMDLVELTDQILNLAKESGGNRVYSSLDVKKTKPSAKLNGKNGNVKFLKEKIEKLSKGANQNLMEAIFAFAKTIKVKDHYTGEHVERTVKYATEIAKTMNLSEHDIELIRQASMLHDLGKIGISEKILLKKGKLTKREFAEIKRHPQIGVDIIRPIQFLHPIIPILLYHHERWDGKGYPNSLKGADIPIGARIVAIADVYQALISERCYRKAYTQDKAIEIIKEGSGKLFDPEIVDAFLRIVDKVE
jgi:diguanylate cyclase (GGDEF)-like protein/PAS domain S-box-containing protein